MTQIKVERAKKLKGEITIPSDKSISHRSAMFAALTGGRVEVENFSIGADCKSTLGIIQKLGCDVKFLSEQKVLIDASNAFKASDYQLDCGNSGTTMRLMSGLLAPIEAPLDGIYTLFGDESLSKRPMKRVIEPLELMGAKIQHNDFKAPLTITGSKLSPISYKSQIASAQVKSCVLLAGLNTEGTTTFEEPYVSRDHTERMLKYLGANISTDKNITKISQSKLEPKNISICGDISSAAFFLVAGAIVSGSEIILKNVGLNPTRTGIIDVLKNMGANLEIRDLKTVSGEEVGDIKISYSQLNATTIEGEIIPRLIDEIPVIAVLATQAEGSTIIKDAQDLRNKESDRIKCLVDELKKIGADIEETPDGMIIHGQSKSGDSIGDSALRGNALVECYHDHRLAMSLYVAGLVSKQPIVINEFQWVDISFPEFLVLVDKLS